MNAHLLAADLSTPVNGHASRALSAASKPSSITSPSCLMPLSQNIEMEHAVTNTTTSLPPLLSTKAGAPTASEQQSREKSSSNSNDLTTDQLARAAAFEMSPDLQELCRDNGLSATQFARRSASVTTLDMFLGFWPSMQSVMYFPALRELSIVKHPTVTTIDGLAHCPHLELLCITECSIERITNLGSCVRLRTLNLSSNRLVRIEHLEHLGQLETLWLNDNRLTSLDGVGSLGQLRQLWACRNRIERLDAATLSGCASLTELNVAANCVSSFKSLLSIKSLPLLRVLTLSDPHFGDNPVCRLCNYQTYVMCHLSRLEYLDTVELATRTKQIADATMLKKTMYYNMRINAIKRDVRARIQRADTVRITAEQHVEAQLAALARAKKEIERYLADLALRDARIGGNAGVSGIGISADTNANGSADTSAKIHTPVNCQAAQELRKKLACVDACLQTTYSAICRMHNECDRVRARLEATADMSIARLLLELETGGNIRLEDGTPLDAWYNSCVDLVRSRLFGTELRAFGVDGISITRVTRISNRYLRHRFHTRMDDVVTVPALALKDNVSKKGVTVPVRESEDPPTTDTANQDTQPTDRQCPATATAADATVDPKIANDPSIGLDNSLEYLFYVPPLPVDDTRRVHEREPFAVAERGFRDPAEYAQLGSSSSESIALANSVALLDAPRLAAALSIKGQQLHQQKQKQPTLPSQDLCSLATRPLHQQRELTNDMRAALALAVRGDWALPSNVLLVVKVFPGYTKTLTATAAHTTTSINACDFPGLQSVQVPSASPPPSLLTGSVTAAAAEAAAKQRHYYLFDKALVLPEYLVEYEYTLAGSTATSVSGTGTSSSSTDAQSIDSIASPRSINTSTDAETTDLGVAATLVDDFERRYCVLSDDDSVTRVLTMEPVLPIPGPTDDGSQIATARLSAAALHCVKHLSLMGCALPLIPDLSPLSTHLEVLVLSDNCIESIHSTAFARLSKLQTLDLSFNRLVRLEHLEPCESLVTLDVAHNALATIDNVVYLGRMFGSRKLRRVDLRNNTLNTTKRYRLHVLKLLPALECLDQLAVTTDEALAAQQLVTTLSAATVWDRFCRRTQVATVPVSARLSASDTVSSDSAVSASQPNWNVVKDIVLHRELIHEIDGLDLATNVRVATFADNVITHIRGLDRCTKLETLSLEDNAIATIEHLDSLVALTKLDLGRNCITAIEHLTNLTNLTQLSLEANAITSLRGLEAAHNLMELYVGSNRITVLKEVQHLKTLAKLTILDLAGNEVTQAPDYRLYTIYYLRRVKVLDSTSVSPQDQSNAKHKYSGRLTIEFILDKCSSAGIELGADTGIDTVNNSSALDRIQVMDLSTCRIRDVGSIPGRVFAHVRELNLENNQISDIAGLEALATLRVLNLSRNRIERLTPVSTAVKSDAFDSRGIVACRHVEQLFLAYNQISDMTALGLQYLANLKVLHLQGNAIVFVAGLDRNTELRELRMDKNRIRQLDGHSTAALQQLRVLTFEDNGLKSLVNVSNLLSLETLDLTSNRLIDLDEVERLAPLSTLSDLRLTGNPVTKKHLYRQTVLFKLQSLRSLDARDVSVDERERVAVLFLHERAAAAMAMAASSTSAAAYNSNNNAGDRYIEARRYSSSSSTPSSIPTKGGVGSGSTSSSSSSTIRATIPPLMMGDVLAGSLLRKHPLASATTKGHTPNQNQYQQFQSRPDFGAADAGIAIAAMNTTARSLLAHTQAASYRNPHSLTNQSAAMVLGASSALSPSSTATVASAFSVTLASGSSVDPFHLGGLRSDRRRMSSVHYDQSFSAKQVGSSSGASPYSHAAQGTHAIGGNELKLPVGIVSSLAVIRGPAQLSGSGQGGSTTHTNYQQQLPLDHPSAPDSPLLSNSNSVLKPTPASLGIAAASRHRSAASDATAATQRARRSVSYANQKRYTAYDDLQPETTAPYFSTKSGPNQSQQPHGRSR